MTPCPRLGEIERLMADPHDEQAWESLHRHLDSCPYCREHIETLAGAATLVPDQPSHWRNRSSSSAALRQAIEQLQESPAAGDVASGPALPTHLSFLRPTERPGFVGRVGKYEVRRVIGHGGMGIVLEALDPVLNRTVAIKMLSPWTVLDDETKTRFLREAQSAAALTHEHVVSIYAVEQVDGLPFLVLEYVAGESLEDRLRRQGKLPLNEVVRIGAQIARGLAAAHAKGLVHRDIKPGNILLTEAADRVKIADFGLAKPAGEEALTVTGTLLGTPGFMSPEQAIGKEPDERSDLFSLGTVLYFAATGVPPFHGPSLFETLDNVRRCQPQPLQDLDPALPDWFCELVHRLLAKDPRKRLGWASAAAELLEQQSPQRTVIESIHAKETVKVGPAAAVSSKFARRWWLIAPLALIAAAVAGVIYAPFMRSERTVPPPPSADDKRPLDPPPPGFIVLGRDEVFERVHEALASATDGDTIEVRGKGPYLTPPLTVTGKRLTIRAAAGSHPIFLFETPSARASQPFLQTDSDLRLEGLEIRWTRDFVAGRSETDMLARSIVVSTQGRLLVAHCRIVSDRFNGCVAGTCRELLLRNCHFAAKDGMGVFWRAELGGKLDIEGCVLDNRVGMHIQVGAGAPQSAPGQVRLSHSTLAGYQALQLLVETPPRQPLPFSADHNIIDSEYLFLLGLTRQPRPKATLPKGDDLPSLVRNWVAWTEEGNVYRRGMHYIARPVLGQKGSPLSAGIAGVDQWLDLWQLPPARSLEGDIRFQTPPDASKSAPLILEAVINPSSSVPANVGAQPNKLGPGPAYHDWRSSPDYAAWPSH